MRVSVYRYILSEGHSVSINKMSSAKCNIWRDKTCCQKLLEQSECNSQFTAMLTGFRSHHVQIWIHEFPSGLWFIFIKLHILVKKEKHSWPSNVWGNSTSLPHLVCGDFYVLVWPRPVSLSPACPTPAAAACLLCQIWLKHTWIPKRMKKNKSWSSWCIRMWVWLSVLASKLARED